MRFLSLLNIKIVSAVALATAASMFVSCDKISELTGGDSNAKGGVESVDEEACKKIISEEERLVVVEFYTDT